MLFVRLLIFIKISILIILVSLLSKQVFPQDTRLETENSAAGQHWVDSVFNALTPTQRIGQLFMLRANSVIDTSEVSRLGNLIKDYDIGGLCFFQGGPVRQANLTNYYQSLAATPLLVAMDAEWGLGMRLDSTISFARQMTLGAIEDERLITDCGLTIAAQLRRMGVQISFSPVADINSNPANPVINIRSFGENKEAVARKSMLYMKALQKGGIISVAKHFPGHGDTDTDSHQALPVIAHSLATIDTLDLYPFKKLLINGIDGLMVAHLNIPVLDSTKNLPSSLSPMVINNLLRNKLGFQGLVFTDALDMKGVAGNSLPGDIELKALKAGADVLLLPISVEKAVNAIQLAIDSGLYSVGDLEAHCKRILACKFKAGLAVSPVIAVKNLVSDLNLANDRHLNLKLYQNAITLLKNDNSIIPLTGPDTLRIASLTIGYDDIRMFQQRMDCFASVEHFTLPRNADKKSIEKLFADLAKFNLLIIGINNTIPSPPRNFGISDVSIQLVDSLLDTKTCILNLFTLPYSINLFKNFQKAKALVVAYQDNEDAYNAVSQMLFGATGACGRLPVSVNSEFPIHSGITTFPVNRLRYNPFEETQINQDALLKVDSIVNEGLAQKAYPGCQVLIAKNGNVFYQKSFGNSDYINNQAVRNSDLYDLASITKAAATTLAVMKLYDEGKVRLDERLSHTLKYLEKSNKSKITIREVLSHQAGLVAWIPFYKNTLINGLPDTLLFSKISTPEFPVRVAEGMYLKQGYWQKILDTIVNSPVSEKKEYLYSDLGFILMQQFVETISGKSLDEFMYENFYKPLGLNTLTYHPRDRFPLSRIMPTENDTIFRHQLLQGDVHDPAAAMMGGVAGHAGLFGTANDLAVIFQLLLQNGNYGGVQYFEPATVDLFTSRQFKGNRRGLGFDKPQLLPSDPGPACKDATEVSFGHTGFTGTYVWADPAMDLIFVFLSNRVNPDAAVNKLAELGIRTSIQQVLYDALNKNRQNGQQYSRKPVTNME